MALTDGGDGGYLTSIEIASGIAPMLDYPTIHPDTDEAALLRSIVQMDRLFARVSNGWGARSAALNHEATVWAASNRFRGDLTFKAYRLRALDWPEHVRVGQAWASRSEGADHATLKLAFREWMRRHGMKDAVTEYRDSYFRYDLFSPSHDVQVEIGHTPIAKLFWAAIHGYRFILIPFRRDFWQAPQRSFAIEFVMTEAARAEARADHKACLDRSAARVGRAFS